MDTNHHQQGNGVKLFEKGTQSFYYVPYLKNGTPKIKQFQSSMGKARAYKLACDFCLTLTGQKRKGSNIFTSPTVSSTHIPFLVRLTYRKLD